MTWSQLHSFVAVADTGSVRAAASRLSVTESAVSASLASLQRTLGFPLVERVGRGLQLTEGGCVYAEYARRILGLLDEARSAAAAASAPERGRLRVGAVPTAAEYVLPGLLSRFHRRYPDVDVTLEVGVRARMHELLASHRVDVAFGGRPPGGEEFVSRARRANALVVIASPDAAPDLYTHTWLMREPGSGTREVAFTLLETLDIQPRILTVGSPGAVVSSAVLGIGVGLVSLDAINREVADGQLVVVSVPGTPIHRRWHVVTPRYATRTAQLFVRYIADPQAVGDMAFEPARAGRPRPDTALAAVRPVEAVG
jgi:DNA-binding transcriptional LysR family regulator